MVRKKFTKKEILLIVFGTIFIISILTFYIWHQVEAVRLGYEINRLEGKVQKLQIEVEELEAERSARLSLEEVERIAKERLKMVETKESQIIYEEFKQQ
jgi:cell division protein FtsL